jgi:uncharacterized membrane protein YcjF (UPF0283 family)
MQETLATLAYAGLFVAVFAFVAAIVIGWRKLFRLD